MNRKTLPNRRYSVTTSFTHKESNGMLTLLTMTVGFINNEPKEVFLSMDKNSSTTLGILARDSGILLSILLQCNMSLDTLAKSISRIGSEDVDINTGLLYKDGVKTETTAPQSIVGSAIDSIIELDKELKKDCIPCSECNGEGDNWNGEDGICPKCNGTGINGF